MAGNDVVRTVTIKTVSDGAPQATKDLQDLAAAQQGVAVASDTTSKSTLSAAAALNKLQNQLDPGYRSLTQLNSAQAMLGKSFDQGLLSVDRYNQLMALASQRFDDAGKKASPFATALTGVKTQIIALSAGLGPVGTALAAFGPAGLAAGAGLALVEGAFDAMSQRADELASKATNLSTFAQITGLTTDQVQALTQTAAKFGVTTDQTQTFIDSFTAKLTELRTASGPLYDAIIKVDAGLAQQMLSARGTAAEFDIYAQAYAKAAAAGNGNSLLVAAGGRGAVVNAPTVSAVANAGSLDALNASMDQGSRLASTEIENLKNLKAENDALGDDIRNNVASLFSTAILSNQVQARTTMEGLTEAAKEFKLSSDWNKFVSDLTTVANADVPTWWKQFYSYVTSPTAAAAPNPIFGNDFGANFNPSHAAEGPPAPVNQPGSIDPTAIANQYKTLVGVLGSGASITDQFNSKLASLVVTARAAGVPADQLTSITGTLADKLNASGGAAGVLQRALNALDIDKQASLWGTYVSALGEFATTQDKATAASLNFQKQQIQNPRLTNDQRDAVVALATANDEWTRASNGAQIGVFDLGAATKAAGDQFKAQLAPGGMLDHATPDQLTAAYQAYANKVQALGDTAKVAGSAFPQLAQLAVDAGNVNKQFDTFASTSLNAISPAFQDMINGTTTLSAGFQNLGLTVVKALENMIIQMTIIKPLAASLGLGGTGTGLLSFLGLGSSSVGSGAAASTISVGSQSFPSFGLPSAKGNIFDNDNLVKFANGGTFTNSIVTSPTLFRFANGAALGQMGEAGPEAIVPLKRGSDGSLGVAGGGGNTIVNVSVENSSGSEVSVGQQKNSSGGVDLKVMIRKAVGTDISQGYHDKALKSRFAVSAQGQKR